MSNYIVLVKQVPDIKQITDNAFDLNTGNLIRSRLASVINDFDAQALAFANQMRSDSNDKNAQLICLTMGPPMAEEVLRYSLSRCADRAILLTDRVLGGADTLATANPLAFAIRKIIKEIFSNNQDYYIISGMQSVDGDTAQVPPQIAEELNLPCIAYATKAEFKSDHFEFTQIISGGSQTVTAKKLPVVITVAKYEYPLFATFAATRRANETEVITWGANDVKPTNMGVQGSKTRVIRVFPPGKSVRKCKQACDVNELAAFITESLKTTNGKKGQNDYKKIKAYKLPNKREDKFDRSFEGTTKEIEDYKLLTDKLNELGIEDVSEIDEEVKEKVLAVSGKRFHKKALEDMIEGLKLTKPTYSGEVWVQVEHNQDQIHSATLELIGKANELADCLDTKAGVVLAGHNVEPMSKELIAAGADKVYLIEHKFLSEFDPIAYRKAVADCITKYWPQIVLYAATPQGRMLAPMISYRVSCGLTADCTSLDIKDSSRKNQLAILYQTRPALGGNVMATICTKDSKCQMATARPGVMKKLEPDSSRTGQIIQHNVELFENDISLKIIKTDLGTGEVNFGAEAIVSGGKGMQSRDNYEKLLDLLCTSLKNKFNITIERGASRAAIEQGFAERIHQIGQTGTAVSPKVYFALGISGAIQHMIGVANTETIIAINRDPNAPIFKQCDYYIIGNVEDIVPQLAKALEVEQSVKQ